MSVVSTIRIAPARIARGFSGARQSAGRLVAPAVEVSRVLIWPLIRPAVLAARSVLRVPTVFGWVVLALALTSWVAGQILGWQELLAVALAATAVLMLALPFIAGRSAYSIDLDLAANRVVVGERAVGHVVVGNTSSRTLLAATIELPVGRGLASFHVPRLGATDIHEDLFTIPTHRRTVLTVGPVRSVRGDPLGLFRRVVNWTEPVELFVHPRTVALEGSSTGFFRDLEGEPTKDLSSDDVSFHALREYIPGDDRRHVHWKSFAHTGKLMVRQFEETRRSHLAIALSRNPADYATSDEFELAVSVCGSLGAQALREEKQLTVLVQGERVKSGSRKQLLDGLSAIVTAESRSTFVQLSRELGSTVPSASVAVLLFGATATPEQIRLASSYVPIGVRVIAVLCGTSIDVSARTIAGAAVLSLGDLGELARGLRRAA
ncbi:DUF58 domain-containing protein [Subtercola sp. PAMC28395]|uniref:DUF58 domain-containing protein n=1 Tax=Subtercola sp. PAMC28395 TaxID=2846775 RepID=UPI001C0CE319|nr:DUF58 domain-containing protein [Subtercola sp. PAMC28395]QWT24555.1 DUF58 domain-containing protein [Subtercola sp. PAMC28395]